MPVLNLNHQVSENPIYKSGAKAQSNGNMNFEKVSSVMRKAIRLSDLSPLLPDELIDSSKINSKDLIIFTSGEEKQLNGEAPEISLKQIYAKHPDIFTEEITDSNDSKIPVPLSIVFNIDVSKLKEQTPPQHSVKSNNANNSNINNNPQSNNYNGGDDKKIANNKNNAFNNAFNNNSQTKSIFSLADDVGDSKAGNNGEHTLSNHNSKAEEKKVSDDNSRNVAKPPHQSQVSILKDKLNKVIFNRQGTDGKLGEDKESDDEFAKVLSLAKGDVTVRLAKLLANVSNKELGFLPKFIPEDLKSKISLDSLKEFSSPGKNMVSLPLGELIGGCPKEYQEPFSRANRKYNIDIPKDVLLEIIKAKSNKGQGDFDNKKSPFKSAKTSNGDYNSFQNNNSQLARGYTNLTKSPNKSFLGINITTSLPQGQFFTRAIFNEERELSIEEILDRMMTLGDIDALSLISEQGGLISYRYEGDEIYENFAKEKAPKIYRNIIGLSYDLDVENPQIFSLTTGIGMVNIFLGESIGLSILQQEKEIPTGLAEKVVLCIKDLEQMIN